MTIHYTVRMSINCKISRMLCGVGTSSSPVILRDAVTVAGNQLLVDVHMLKYKSGTLKCNHRKESLPVL